jgi:hypothetical protein
MIGLSEIHKNMTICAAEKTLWYVTFTVKNSKLLAKNRDL